MPDRFTLSTKWPLFIWIRGSHKFLNHFQGRFCERRERSDPTLNERIGVGGSKLKDLKQLSHQFSSQRASVTQAYRRTEEMNLTGQTE